MDSFFVTVTWLGSLAILLPLSALLCAIFFSLQKGTEGVFIMLSLLGTSAITHLLKILIARPRPAVENLIVALPSDFSFPSAHTSQATAVAIALCLVAAGKVGQPTVFLIWGACITLAGLVGYSRIYLRVHYLTDVIAGATVGLFCVFVFAQVFGIPKHP